MWFSKHFHVTHLVFIATREVGTIISPFFTKKRMGLEESKWFFFPNMNHLINGKTGMEADLLISCILLHAVSAKPGIWEARELISWFLYQKQQQTVWALCVNSAIEILINSSYPPLFTWDGRSAWEIRWHPQNRPSGNTEAQSWG